LGSADDIVEIMMLKGKYVHAVDERRVDDLVALFTPDAVVDASAATGEIWRDTEGLRDGYERWVPPIEMHATTNPLIEVDGDAATGRWYALFAGNRDGTPVSKTGVLSGCAYYTEEYVKVEGRWMIKKIAITFPSSVR
jgi:hypothetical protein